MIAIHVVLEEVAMGDLLNKVCGFFGKEFPKPIFLAGAGEVIPQVRLDCRLLTCSLRKKINSF